MWGAGRSTNAGSHAGPLCGESAISYALAMRCPVLAWCVWYCRATQCLVRAKRTCYAMSGTDLAHGGRFRL
eukprot:3275158-Rhodomonas_salina.2